MKVLFICSGNRVGVSPIIKNQAESLIAKGIEIEYFTIIGKGWKGYFNNIKKIRLYLKTHKYDIVHVHYSLSAFVTSLAGARALVVSLMGSDLKAAKWYKYIILLFQFLFQWKAVIVKSQDMYNELNLKSARIIPNGVNTDKFRPMDKTDCQKQLNWDSSKKHILFPASPYRREKNYSLALDAVHTLRKEDVVLHYFDNIPNSVTPIWYNAADVVIMTSLWEGSPNAIKEALACCRPIVTTNVGDVNFLLGNVAGTFISSFNKEEISSCLNNALQYNGTDGLKHIQSIQITSSIIAQKIINIYTNQ